MGARKASAGFGRADIVDLRYHKDGHAALDYGPDQRCDPLCEEECARGDMEIMRQFHVGHESDHSQKSLLGTWNRERSSLESLRHSNIT